MHRLCDREASKHATRGQLVPLTLRPKIFSIAVPPSTAAAADTCRSTSITCRAGREDGWFQRHV